MRRLVRLTGAPGRCRLRGDLEVALARGLDMCVGPAADELDHYLVGAARTTTRRSSGSRQCRRRGGPRRGSCACPTGRQDGPTNWGWLAGCPVSVVAVARPAWARLRRSTSSGHRGPSGPPSRASRLVFRRPPTRPRRSMDRVSSGGQDGGDHASRAQPLIWTEGTTKRRPSRRTWGNRASSRRLVPSSPSAARTFLLLVDDRSIRAIISGRK
jgi:hypothetical protein